MDLNAIRNTGIDWACTIEEKLRQLQLPTYGSSNGQPSDSRGRGSGNGNFVTRNIGGGQIGHLWKVGKHRLLSTTGVLQESVDNDYYERVSASTHSKALLLQIENEFKAVVDSVQNLSTHYDTLLSLLEKFRATCDDQLARDADQEEMKNWEHAQHTEGHKGSNVGSGSHDHGHANDFVMISSPPSMTAASNTNHTARYRITPVDAKLSSLRKSLAKAADDLRDNVKNSCQPISLTTRTELDKTQTSIIADVTSKKATYDLTKHKARSKGLLVMTPNNNSSSRAGLQHSVGGGGGGSDPVNPSSFSSAESMAGNTTTTIALPTNPTAADLQLRDELLDTKEAYDESAIIAKHKLHFLLEQTSMSTWACYNVFFQLMANYYGEVLKSNAALAKVLVELKNEQSISQQLTAERKEKLIKRTEAVMEAKEKERMASSNPKVEEDTNNNEEFGEFLSSTNGQTTTTTTTPHPGGSSRAPPAKTTQQKAATDWDDMFS